VIITVWISVEDGHFVADLGIFYPCFCKFSCKLLRDDGNVSCVIVDILIWYVWYSNKNRYSCCWQGSLQFTPVSNTSNS